jgi:glycosidase
MIAQDLSQEVIYHILIDRFTGDPKKQDIVPPEWCGGTIRGITNKLDHIQALGATSILLTPFFQGVNYHGYHTTDFGAVDEHFGTMRDLKQLASELHSRGMRLIIDYVPNHCHIDHPFFLEATRDPSSRFRDWFIFDHWPDRFKTFLWTPDLPKFNLENPAVRHYFIDNALWWLKEVDFDGLRVDHTIGPPMDFWPPFIARLKASKPSLFFIAEVWINMAVTLRMRDRVAVNPMDLLLNDYFTDFINEKYTRRYLKHFDATLDFTFNRLATSYAKGLLGQEQLAEKLTNHYSRLPKTGFWPTFLDNPDMNRVLYNSSGDVAKVKHLIDLQFQINQPKMIYYGTEFGLSQSSSVIEMAPFGDLPARNCPLWSQAGKHELFHHYQSLTSARH